MNGYSENEELQCEISDFEMEECTGYKVFNDSVHGHITLHPLLVRVVDTPEFQRLRNLKQVGLAYYVFPGAGHCRFEHSLGTCYLAGQMVKKLLSQQSQSHRSRDEIERIVLCVQMAALCHDLGHGPFSHTWEAVTARWNDSWKHEQASCDMFDYLVKKNKLEDIFNHYGLNRELIKEFIIGGPTGKGLLDSQDNFLYEIVSNKNSGIDVDKWDYFLRDGLHLNLRITFDYRRLLEFCIVTRAKTPGGDTHLAFRDKEIMNLYDMYRVRSALHHNAYRHKVVINIELMLVDAFSLAGDAGYKINNSDIYLKEAHRRPEHLYELTDHIFYDLLYSRDERFQTSRELLLRICRRQLYHFVGTTNVTLSPHRRKEDLSEKMKNLKKHLNTISTSFRVVEFFLDLDCENDPISRVTFYQKLKGINAIQEVDFQEIKYLLGPFPFQLTKETTAELLVFCTSANIPEETLEDAKQVMKRFSDHSTNC